MTLLHKTALMVSALLLTGATAHAGPKRVLIIGDSMMRIPAHSLERALSRVEGVETRSYTSLGSGLARLDVFDWMGKIDELTADFKPDITLVWFGTNDRQAIRTGDTVLQPTDPAWDDEYGRRVGQAMDKLLAKEGARVIWLELPDMREPKVAEDVTVINRIVKGEADKRKNVEFFPTRALLSRQPGTYSPYVIGPNGMPLQVRDADGVHLNRAGADRLADALVKHLFGAAGR